MAYLRERRTDGGQALWVRINALGTDHSEQDLAAVIPAQPAGIVLPKCNSPEDVLQLASRLDEMEATAGSRRGRTGIIPIVTESPGGGFSAWRIYPGYPALERPDLGC